MLVTQVEIVFLFYFNMIFRYEDWFIFWDGALLTLSSLCNPGWAQIHSDPPASASGMPGVLQGFLKELHSRKISDELKPRQQVTWVPGQVNLMGKRCHERKFPQPQTTMSTVWCPHWSHARHAQAAVITLGRRDSATRQKSVFHIL